MRQIHSAVLRLQIAIEELEERLADACASKFEPELDELLAMRSGAAGHVLDAMASFLRELFDEPPPD